MTPVNLLRLNVCARGCSVEREYSVIDVLLVVYFNFTAQAKTFLRVGRVIVRLDCCI